MATVLFNKHERMDDAYGVNNTDSTSSTSLNADQLTEYFNVIASIGLQGVSNEPMRLRSEANTITEAITKHSLANYQTYLNHADASDELASTIASLTTMLNDIVAYMPRLSSDIVSFNTYDGKELLKDFTRNRTTIRHHSSLLGNSYQHQIFNSYTYAYITC